MPIERAVYHSSAWSVYWTAPGAAPPPVSLTPVAAFTAVQQKPTSTVSFDASGSFETGGSIVSYAWDFGDGAAVVTTTNTVLSHSYTKAGNYSATLTVTDAVGSRASVTKSVSVVLNQVPVASFTAAINGLTASVDGSASSDPDGTISTYAWDFGDGAIASGITASHNYSAGGTYTIVLKVTDNQGAFATSSKSVSLSAGPVAAFTQTVSGLGVNVDASPTSDPNPISSYAWNWGENITIPTYTFNTSADGHAVTLQPSIGNVIQCVVKSPDTGNVYATQARNGSNGTASPYQTTQLNRMNSSGVLIDYMELIDAGHGTSFALENTGGKTYVWLSWQAPASGGASWDLVRFPYPVGGGSYTRSSPPPGMTVPYPGGLGNGHKTDVQFDVQKDRVVIRTTPTSTTNTFRQAVLSDFLAGTVTVYNTVTLPVGPPSMQGFFTFDYSLFVYWGAPYTQATSTDPVLDSSDPPILKEYRWYDGKEIASYDPSVWDRQADGGYLSNHYEPESATLYYPVGGTPSAYVGWVTGTTGAYNYDIINVPLTAGTQSVPVKTSTGKTAGHSYATAGTYNITLSVQDTIGLTDTATNSVAVGTTVVNQPPVASFVTNTTNLAVSFDGSGSKDPDGTIASYAWTFGDGTAGTGVTASHTYATAGTYTVTLKVTDNQGATGTASKTVSPTAGSTGSLPVYLQGDMMQGIPASTTVPRYDFAALGLTTATTNLQTVVDKLPGPGIIQLPPNWTGHIPNFSHHGSNFGIFNSNLRGMIGNISNGVITTKVVIDPGAVSATQATNLGAQAKGTTTQLGAYHINNTSAHYLTGIHFIGSDQRVFTDSYNGRTGPCVHGGLFLNNTGLGTIVQNCLIQGFGRADDSTPPGEVGEWSETHSVNLILRRVEQDGRIPATASTDPYGMAWRRGGGIQFNAATNFLVEDVYSHDTWASGVTMSFTGTPTSTASQSNNWTSRRLHVENNAGHGTAPGGQNSGSFRPLNMEFNHGTIHHYQPHFSSPYWAGGDNAHIKMWMYNANPLWQGDPNTQVYVHQPIWDNANPLDNGCFSIYYAGLKTIGGKAPIVYLTSDETKPATPYIVKVGTQVPSTVSKANNYYVLKYT